MDNGFTEASLLHNLKTGILTRPSFRGPTHFSCGKHVVAFPGVKSATRLSASLLACGETMLARPPRRFSCQEEWVGLSFSILEGGE